MLILVALAIGSVIWISGWALGLKSFDSFMVLVLLLVVATAVRSISPFLRQQLGRGD